MKVRSAYVSKSFIQYMVLEHLLSTVLIGVAAPLVGFYFSMSRASSEVAVRKFNTIFAHEGKDLMLLALGVAVVWNIALFAFRNIRYVVSLEMDDARHVLVVGVRRLLVRSYMEHHIAYDRLSWSKYQTAKFPGMNGYAGYELRDDGRSIGYFLPDHFMWEDQRRHVKAFLAGLNERVPISR